MKTKPTHKKTDLATFAILIIAAVAIVCTIVMLIGSIRPQFGSYKIPEDYLSATHNDQSKVDDPDKTCYTYPDKTICEITQFYPAGGLFDYTGTRTIVVYDNVTDPNQIKDQKGREIIKEYR